ncbi:MAG: NAD-dependent malic enzyme [Firmicutes bacterium]|nr:NAD-dependent malic enzyme [Bacillota bacterium]
MPTFKEEALSLHRDFQGKIEVVSKVPVNNFHDMTLAYSPGVAEPCRLICKNPENTYKYTVKGNLVGVVTDGTAVLGLGDIGPSAALPVMEGKAVLFKLFAGVDAIPLCIGTKDVDKIVEVVKLLEPALGGVNLEDIAAPRCFEIENKLKQATSIPIFHDDQHGTAVVVASGLINALKVVNKRFKDIKVVINGAGASAISVAKLLMFFGVNDIIMCDSKGIIFEGRRGGMNPYKEEMARLTNRSRLAGSLPDAVEQAEVFIGLSKAGQLTKEMVLRMAPEPIVFALANPDPEIHPQEALNAGAAVVGTGRSDFPNQVNNVLGFPGIFRGALDVRAVDININMKFAAAHAIASLIDESELSPDYVIPDMFDPRVAPAVARAVAIAAMDSGVARVEVDPDAVAERTRRLAMAANGWVGTRSLNIIKRYT